MVSTKEYSNAVKCLSSNIIVKYHGDSNVYHSQLINIEGIESQVNQKAAKYMAMAINEMQSAIRERALKIAKRMHGDATDALR